MDQVAGLLRRRDGSGGGMAQVAEWLKLVYLLFCKRLPRCHGFDSRSFPQI